jgi:enterochelin esterase-like enzyme
VYCIDNQAHDDEDERMQSWKFTSLGLLVLGLMLQLVAEAQPNRPPRIVSPEVTAEKQVTFRLLAPNAKEVRVALEGSSPRAMQQDQQGVWTVTTEPLEPDLYGYSFSVDGITITDPSNHLTKPNFIYPSSAVHVPGPPSLPWEINDVPRGTLHRHFYRSGVVGDHRDFFVYTPPGYDQTRRNYPILYLLHGFSDDASGWTAVGRAHVIFDNLIAQGKAKPMIVVMPLGYGAPEIVMPGVRASSGPDLWQKNVDLFRDALLQEVLPAVEKLYRVSANRESRAITGLSMGGTESLLTGLNALDRFAWIGSFSAGGLRQDLDQAFPGLDKKANERVRLLWIACGREDGLIEANRKLVDWLKKKEIRHTWLETGGAHTWMVWRRNLAEFASLLF